MWMWMKAGWWRREMLLLLCCGIWNCELRDLLPVRSIRGQFGKTQNQRFRVPGNGRVQRPTNDARPQIPAIATGGCGSPENVAYFATALIEDVHLWRGGEACRCGLLTNGDDDQIRPAGRRANATV